MHVLICSATTPELEPDLGNFSQTPSPLPFIRRYSHINGKLTIDLLVSGAGQVSTAITLTKAFAGTQYDLAINTGLAGTFGEFNDRTEVVLIKQDCFSDLGAQDDQEFLTITDLNLPVYGSHFFENGWLKPKEVNLKSLENLRKVKGITVNTVHGETEAIRKVVKRLNPDVETMEGAAFFLAAMDAEVPCIQIRAISNKVEKRNREAWKIKEALFAANKKLSQVLNEILSNSIK